MREIHIEEAVRERLERLYLRFELLNRDVLRLAQERETLAREIQAELAKFSRGGVVEPVWENYELKALRVEEREEEGNKEWSSPKQGGSTPFS
ncbi:MAG: hypothetical protein ABC559_02000 [Candidatus Methanosuratincola petrocarbonis]